MRQLVCAALLALVPASVTLGESAPQHARPAATSSAEASAWAHDHLQGWPPETIALAVTLIAKYGRPADATAHLITWYDNGPWKRTTLLREGKPHNFPLPHQDVLEQTIDYRVPAKKLADLAAYDGSIVVDRTRGELTVHCNSEEMNTITFNIADDIVKGERTVEQARAYHAQVIEGMLIHDPETYPQKLRFKTQKSNTGDTDEEAELLRHLSR